MNMRLKFTVEIRDYEPLVDDITSSEIEDAITSLLVGKSDDGTVVITRITTEERARTTKGGRRIESPGQRHREITDGGSA